MCSFSIGSSRGALGEGYHPVAAAAAHPANVWRYAKLALELMQNARSGKTIAKAMRTALGLCGLLSSQNAG